MVGNISNNIIKEVWKYAKPYKFSFITLYICLIIEIIINKALPMLIGILVDEVFYHRNLSAFLGISLIYGILFFGNLANYIMYMSLWQYIYNNYIISIRQYLFRRLVNMKAYLLNDVKSGDVLSIMDNDSNEFLHIIQRYTFRTINLGINYILSIIIVARISYKAVMLMIVITPLSIYISQKFEKKIRNISKRVRDKYGIYISWVVEILKSIREVKLIGSDKTIRKIFFRFNKDIIRAETEQSKVTFTSRNVTDFVSLLSDLALYIVATLLIINNEITIGMFIVLVIYFKESNIVLKSLIYRNMDLQTRLASINRVIDLLAVETEEDNKGRTKELTVKNGCVEFSNISFSYDSRRKVIDNLSLHVKEYECLSIVGGSGTGKSTLAYLLLNFYDVDDGDIIIDGQKLNECSVESIRKNIGVVHQEPLFFDNTIRYNLQAVKEDATEDEIWDACTKACISEVIKRLPNGLDTVIGKGGVGLSSGQTQRLSIARVLLKNPQILILDEATSALDYETEQEVQKAWYNLAKNRTTIIIAHRFLSIINSDRIAVMDKGTIVSCGSYEYLSENCSYFKTLFKKDILERESKHDK